MNRAELLSFLEMNLEIITDYMDADSLAKLETQLGQYLDSAQKFIETEGITLDLEEAGDCQLLIMYASWLYEKRKAVSIGLNTSIVAMPRMLRWNLNNRLFHQKVGE